MHVFDYITLSIVLVEVLYAALVTVCIVGIPKVRNYLPIRFQKGKIICFMGFAGVIQTVCAFLSNEHYPLVETFDNTWICMIVTVWTQYFIGLNFWIMSLEKLMIDYGTFFKPGLFNFVCCTRKGDTQIQMISITEKYSNLNNSSDAPRERVTGIKYTWIIYLTPSLFAVPLFLYTVQYIQLETVCRTWDVVKFYLVSWCCLSVISVAFVNKKLRSIPCRKEDFKAYKPIETILHFGIVTILLNSSIQFNALWVYPSMRALATSSISLLHIMGIYVLIGKHVYHALRDDRKYAVDYVKTHDTTFRAPIHSEERKSELPQFLAFIASECEISGKLPFLLATAKTLIEMLEALSQWNSSLQIDLVERGASFLRKDYVHPGWQNIIDNYFDYKSPKCMSIILSWHMTTGMIHTQDGPTHLLVTDPESVFAVMSLDVLQNYIYSFLDTHFGAEYDALKQHSTDQDKILKKFATTNYEFEEFVL